MTAISSPSTSSTVYTGRTTGWPVVVLSGVLAVVLVTAGGFGDGGWLSLGLPLILVAIGVIGEVLTSSSVRVTAGPNGFDVRWGILGWPRCTYRLDQIERAAVVDVPLWRVSFGFWWTPRRTTCTMRAGDNVRLWLTSGRIVTITVPDPATAVEIIEAARTRSAGAGAR